MCCVMQAGGLSPVLAPQANGDDPQHHGGQVLLQLPGVGGHHRWVARGGEWRGEMKGSGRGGGLLEFKCEVGRKEGVGFSG